MFRVVIILTIRLVRSLFKSEDDLRLENLALRQQLCVYKSKMRRPRLRNADRDFWAALCRVCPRWTDALVLVKPETVTKWHREGFRIFWKWKSKPKKTGRPRVEKVVRDLIRKMVFENNWGAPRIHAELRKLGFDVNERTVSRYMPKRPTPKDAAKRCFGALDSFCKKRAPRTCRHFERSAS